MTGGLSLRNGSRALAHRNYRLFFGGQGISLIGTWMQTTAQAWLVLTLTSDPFMLGLLAAVQFLPVLVLGLFGGLIADALPKRKTLIVTQTVQMLLAFALFALAQTGTVQVWQILVLGALLGITNAFDMPTRQSFVVEMVGRDDVQNAVALNSAMFNGARIIGPAVAGIAIRIFGIPVAFLLNGLSFIAVIIAYAVMRDDALRSPAHYSRPSTVRAVGQTLADGLRYTWRSPMLLLPVVIVGLASTFGMNFGVVIPSLAYSVLQTDALGFGILMAATGIGSMVAALLIAFSGRTSPMLIGLGSLVLGVGLGAAGLIHAFALALPAMALVGFGAIGMAATANTTIQLHVEDAYRGRVMSVYTTVFAGSTPVGGLFVGWLAASYSVDASLLVSGVLCVLTGLAAIVWLRQIRARGLGAMPREAIGAASAGASTAGARPR
jgi:MFS family permease